MPKAFLEDAAACTLYAGLTYLVEPDGTVEAITHELIRFNGRKGIDKLGEYRNIVYTPAYQQLTLNEARVIKAAGKTVPVEPRHLHLRDVATDYQVYDPDKQLVVSFPNLEVGDLIEVKWTTRGKNPEYQGQFFGRYRFGDDQFPVAQEELRIREPKAMPLRHATVGGRLEPQVREDDRFRTYHWHATSLRELPQDDNLPSKEHLRLELAYSTLPSWDAVEKWERQARSRCSRCTPEVRQVVREVTRGLTRPEEKARALTHWVRRQIRYLSAGERHDYTPLAPGVVLRYRYGDCKDQSQLLVVMLREAGVPAGVATLGARDDGQVLESVPSPWGTHAIVVVPIDGHDHWIDTTISLAAWDFLPRDDRNRLTYVLDDRRLRLVRTPGLTPEDNRIVQTTQVSVGSDGSSRSERVSTHYGLAALHRRDDWTGVPPGERRRLVAAELQDSQSRARLVRLSLDEQELQDFDRPVTARVVFETPGHFVGEPQREGSLSDSKVWSKLLAFNADYDRTAPLELPAPFESIHHYVVQLPPSYRADEMPAEKSIRSPWGFFRLSVDLDAPDPHRLEITYHTRLEKTRVEPADFDAFRKFHEEVLRSYRAWLTISRTRNLADAPALEAVLVLAPGDRISAEVLARLYEENGKAKEARRVVERARGYHPDDTVLWELSVQVAETRAQEEAAYRELMKRYPDEPKYAIALGTSRIDHGDSAGARSVLEPFTSRGPDSSRATAHFQLARGEFLAGKPGRALAEWDLAEKTDAGTGYTPEAWRLRARICEKLDRPADAVAAYRLALKREPESEETLLALVRLGLATADRTAALDALRRYTVAIGDRPDGLTRAADLYLRLGHDDDAFDLATRADRAGVSPRAQRILGLIAFNRHDYERAVTHLNRVEADAETIESLIRAQLALGRLGDAERQAERAVKVAQPSQSLLDVCGELVALAHRRIDVRRAIHAPADQPDAWSRAIDQCVCAERAFAAGAPRSEVEGLLAPAISDSVQLGPAYALRGLLSLDHGRLSKALADAERAVQLSPGEARGFYVRGRVRLERGRDGATEDLRKAVQLSGRNQAVELHWLATALRRQGKLEEALRCQREAVRFRPHDPELLEQLRELEKAVRPALTGP
jgi:tetratricopeptide (TPR) repeat protein/transglutaminase-like putative cysteine protease